MKKRALKGGCRVRGVRAAAAAAAAAAAVDSRAIANELGSTYFLFLRLKEHQKLGYSLKFWVREKIYLAKMAFRSFIFCLRIC